MNRHLVPIEVSVKCRTDQRVQLNRLAFDQHRFERLYAQTMQGRCTVEHDRVFANNLFENIPDFRTFAFHQFLGRLDGGCQTTQLQLAENERLEQFERHALGQTTLVQAQCRAHHDNGTAGVIDALAQQVLTEAALLALDHVSQRFQRALVGTGDGTATTTVIQQRIH